MKIKKASGLLCLISTATGAFLICNLAKAETLFTCQDGDTVYETFYTSAWRGETFTTGDSTSSVDTISLKLFKENTVNELTIGLRETVDNLPVSSDLCTATRTASDITTDSSGNWYDFTFTDCALDNSTTYAIVIEPAFSSPNVIGWRALEGAGACAGLVVGSANQGSTWVDLESGGDFVFRILGEGVGESTTSTASEWSEINDPGVYPTIFFFMFVIFFASFVIVLKI